MTTVIKNYADVLYSLDIDRTGIEDAKKVFADNEQLTAALCDPRVAFDKKEQIINRIFSGLTASFFKVVCKNGRIKELPSIFEQYEKTVLESKNILTASIKCIVLPTDEQLERIKAFLCKRYGANDVKFDIIYDKSIIGGFIIKCGDMEFDRSLKGRINKLQQKLIGDINYGNNQLRPNCINLKGRD